MANQEPKRFERTQEEIRDAAERWLAVLMSDEANITSRRHFEQVRKAAELSYTDLGTTEEKVQKADRAAHVRRSRWLIEKMRASTGGTEYGAMLVNSMRLYNLTPRQLGTTKTEITQLLTAAKQRHPEPAELPKAPVSKRAAKREFGHTTERQTEHTPAV